jgi:hypothetical protein
MIYKKCKNVQYSDKLRMQAGKIDELLKIADPLIIKNYLVPITEDEFDSMCEVVAVKDYFPPDYRYWITHYGSGIIDTIYGDIAVPSIFDLVYQFRFSSNIGGSDKFAVKRISMHGAAPSGYCMDRNIMDADGLCPVVETFSGLGLIDYVHGSSWLMHVAGEICDMGKKQYRNEYLREDTLEETRKAIKLLHEINMASFDEGFSASHSLAMALNDEIERNGGKTTKEKEICYRQMPDSYIRKYFAPLLGKMSESKYKAKKRENVVYDTLLSIIGSPDTTIKIGSLEDVILYYDLMLKNGLTEDLGLWETLPKFNNETIYSLHDAIYSCIKDKDYPILLKLIDHPLDSLRQAASKAIEDNLKASKNNSKLDEIVKIYNNTRRLDIKDYLWKNILVDSDKIKTNMNRVNAFFDGSPSTVGLEK